MQLSHRNLMSLTAGVEDILDLPDRGAKVISWLPAAHIAERGAHYYLPVVRGCSVTICPDPRKIVEFLPRVNPTWFFAVPRIWEKLKAGLEAKLAAVPGEAGEQARQGLEAALQKVRLEQAGEDVPEQLAAAVAAADEALFSNLRVALGVLLGLDPRLDGSLQLLPDARHGEEPRRIDPREELDDLAGVGADRHGAAADDRQVVVRASLGDVRGRQPGDHLRAPIGEVEDVLDARGERHEVAVAELHALRRPGRAGGVDQRQQVIRPDRVDALTDVELGIHRLDLAKRHIAAIAADHHELLQPGQLSASLGEALEEHGLDERDLGLGVGAHVLDLFG